MTASWEAHPGGVSFVMFAPDGRRILTLGGDRVARLWDVVTQKTVAKLEHSASPYSSQFSPDGRHLLTITEDSTAYVWDASTGRELLRVTRPAGAVLSAIFIPGGFNGKLIATSYKSAAQLMNCELCGTTEEVLELAKRRLSGREFTPEERRKYLHEL